MYKSYAACFKLLFVLIAISFCNPLFAAKKKKAADTSVSTQKTDTSKGETIKLPVPNKKTFFYKIDSEVLQGVEIGSPESIRSAMSLIRKSKGDYEENEKVLINIAAEIMKYAWPSEKITWEIPAVNADNTYLGAVYMARQGVFDSSTGNVDFLSIILPALVLLNPIASDTVVAQCEIPVKTALAIRPESVLAQYLMALFNERKGLVQDAASCMASVYKSCPAVEEVSLAYVRLLRQNGQYDKALEVLGKVSGDSNDIRILKQNAYIAFEKKDYSSAELYVARVLQQAPNDLEFVLFRAKILIEKNDYIHAVSLLDMYARQDNTSIDYLILRAKVQLDWSKNTASATETVEKALELYPDNKDALMFAARISSMTDSPVAGKYADELTAKILSADPENLQAMEYALEGLVQRENWQEAYSICKKLIQSKTMTSELVEKYVTICIKLGKAQEAFDYVRKVYDANSSDEVLMQAYVLAYCQVGNRDSVLRYLDTQIATATPKMKSYLLYRRSFLQLTENNILADLRSSLISNPRNSDALFRLYEIYYDKKDYRKAQYYLRQVVAINPNDSSVKKLNEALTKLIQ
ncbi:MAG: tetratricopeptide repeat protein [Treponema sp.]|nr:tetratricopeptide repeat protein [Treponema sp.]